MSRDRTPSGAIGTGCSNFLILADAHADFQSLLGVNMSAFASSLLSYVIDILFLC